VANLGVPGSILGNIGQPLTHDAAPYDADDDTAEVAHEDTVLLRIVSEREVESTIAGPSEA
jgi:hypothetical protein